MKIEKKCIPCIVNQAVKFCDAANCENISPVLRRVFEYLSHVDFDASVTPEVVGEIFSIVSAESGNNDPYFAARSFYNKMMSEQIPALEKHINSAEDPFAAAVRYSIIGNIIDFSPEQDLSPEAVMGYFARYGDISPVIDDTNLLKKDIASAETVLYLGDNCGEICLDRLLLKRIKVLNHHCRIYFAVKGRAVLNDSVAEDAYDVGIQEYAEVIDSGDSSPGTVLHRISPRLKNIFEHADVIISKGQANFECLSEEKRNIYFLLMAKCAMIAEKNGVDRMSMICKRQSK